jgi:uncharacterized membrane protein YphA (DoxX/SURF4 family)
MLTPNGLWRRGERGDYCARIVLGIRILAAVVWFVFGTIFKVMSTVPRHREIVATILGDENAPLITVLIGLGETVLGLWFLIGFLPRTCAALQTAAIISMNTLELIYARSHLLAPVTMVIVNAIFLALVWSAALYAPLKNPDVSADRT